MRSTEDLCTAWLYLGRCREARGDLIGANDAFATGQRLGCGSPFDDYLQHVERLTRRSPRAIRSGTSISRAQLASAVYELFLRRRGQSVRASDAKDVRGHWAEEAIAGVVEAGVMDVLPDSLFHPEAPVTRAAFYVTVGRLVDELRLDPEVMGSLFPAGLRTEITAGPSDPQKGLISGLDATHILDLVAAAAGS